jgi:hypothetical protein
MLLQISKCWYTFIFSVTVMIGRTKRAYRSSIIQKLLNIMRLFCVRIVLKLQNLIQRAMSYLATCFKLGLYYFDSVLILIRYSSFIFQTGCLFITDAFQIQICSCPQLPFQLWNWEFFMLSRESVIHFILSTDFTVHPLIVRLKTYTELHETLRACSKFFTVCPR